MGDLPIDIPLLEEPHFCKVSADLPDGLWQLSSDYRCGGGGPNSVLGALAGAPTCLSGTWSAPHPIQSYIAASTYLESNCALWTCVRL